MKLINQVFVLVLSQLVSCQHEKLSPQNDAVSEGHRHHRCGGPNQIRCPHNFYCKKESGRPHAFGTCVRKDHHPHRCGGPNHIRCPHNLRCKKESGGPHAFGTCVRKNYL